jgi:hypothetical protein
LNGKQQFSCGASPRRGGAALISMPVAKAADRLGRKPILLVGLGAVSVRAVLFSIVSDPWILLPIQLLDGLSAAVIGVMMPLVIADLTCGTGRYNLAQGFCGNRNRDPASPTRLSLRPSASARMMKAKTIAMAEDEDVERGC